MAFGKLYNVKISRPGVEAHSSFGVRERFHQPLRTISRKVLLDYPKTTKSLVLSACVKAINDTIEPEGLVPSALSFGEYLKLQMDVNWKVRASLSERAEVANKSRDKTTHHIAKRLVQRALRHQVLPAAHREFQIGNKVLVWKESLMANKIEKRVGPFQIM